MSISELNDFSMSNWSKIQWFFYNFFIFTNFNNFSWNSMIFPWSWNRSEFQWFFKTCENPDLATGHQVWNNAENRADPGDWSVAVSWWGKCFIPGAVWSFFPCALRSFCSFSMKGWSWGMIRSDLHGFCGPMKTLTNVINLPCMTYDNFQLLVTQKFFMSFSPCVLKFMRDRPTPHGCLRTVSQN